MPTGKTTLPRQPATHRSTPMHWACRTQVRHPSRQALPVPWLTVRIAKQTRLCSMISTLRNRRPMALVPWKVEMLTPRTVIPRKTKSTLRCDRKWGTPRPLEVLTSLRQWHLIQRRCPVRVVWQIWSAFIRARAALVAQAACQSQPPPVMRIMLQGQLRAKTWSCPRWKGWAFLMQYMATCTPLELTCCLMTLVVGSQGSLRASLLWRPAALTFQMSVSRTVKSHQCKDKVQGFQASLLTSTMLQKWLRA
mmetsp:Transcript_66/g.241  ORF Transcript_66/g.241 Transcript_66/m.241 type:complete len:250 (-) Transcript_66:82-831(-)